MESIVVKRTIFVDNFRFSVNLWKVPCPISFSRSYQSEETLNPKIDIGIEMEIYLIVFNDHRSIQNINNILKELDEENSNKCQILVHLKINKGNSEIDKYELKQLCRRYNIECIEASLESEDSIQRLFTFAIKYYWFNKVMLSKK